MNSEKKINWHACQTIIAAFALTAAAYIGYVQNNINRELTKLQDIVEIVATPGIKQHMRYDIASGSDTTVGQLPVIVLQNVGSLNLYLKGYIFDGTPYPLNGVSLGRSGNIYHIELPTNGKTRVTAQIYFEDSIDRKWQSNITAEVDFRGGASGSNLGTWKVWNTKRTPINNIPNFQ